MMEFPVEFAVVEEKAISDLITNYEEPPCFRGNCCCKDHRYLSKFSDVTQFAALDFRMHNFKHELEIKDIVNDACPNVPLAQIIQWEWNGNASQRVRETKILYMGGNVTFSIATPPYSSFVVRILKKWVKSDENPFPPLSNSSDDVFTIQIGGKKVTVSAARLMSMSPMVHRMLSVEMREKQQRALTLNELDVDMEQFMEFLEYMTPIALHQPILPNRNNVLMLLKLADYFQVDWLKMRCEAHLTNCVELPLVERFLLTEKYGLNNLKNYFLHLSVGRLRTFFKANREQLLSVVSKEFLADLSARLCG